MNLKVNNMQQLVQTQQKTTTAETDSSFRFALLSNLEENELQSQLSLMMEDIIQQGDRLSRKMDVRDMKQYRETHSGIYE